MNRYVEWILNMRVYLQQKRKRSENVAVKRKSILVISRHPLGDTVVESPIFKQLRKDYPEHYIMVICSEKNKELFDYCPYINELLPYKDLQGKHYYTNNLSQCRNFAKKKFNDKRFSLVVIPAIGMPSLIDAWLAYFSHADRRVTFSEKENPILHREYMGMYDRFFTNVLSGERRHDVLEYQRMLSVVNCDVDSMQYELWTSKEDKAFAENLYKQEDISKNKIRCIVNLSTSVKSKDWPVERYIEVCNKIKQKFKVEYILVGAGKTADEYGKIFCEQVRGAHNFVNKTTIRQMIEVIKNADVYIGGDTGPMHIAAAAHLSGVAIFKSADNTCWLEAFHKRLYPWQANIRVLHPHKCFEGCENGCKKEYPHCIKLVSTEKVYGKLFQVLQEIQIKEN